jgi:hypothetical protein
MGNIRQSRSPRSLFFATVIRGLRLLSIDSFGVESPNGHIRRMPIRLGNEYNYYLAMGGMGM